MMKNIEIVKEMRDLVGGFANENQERTKDLKKEAWYYLKTDYNEMFMYFTDVVDISVTMQNSSSERLTIVFRGKNKNVTQIKQFVNLKADNWKEVLKMIVIDVMETEYEIIFEK